MSFIPSRNPDEPRGNGSVMVMFLAFAILVVMSMLPWGRLTGNLLKDFNLLGDLFPSDNTQYVFTDMPVDPMMEEFLAEESASPVSTADSMTEKTVATAATAKDVKSEEEAVASVRPLPSKAPRIGDMVAIEDYSADGNGLANLKQALASGGRPARIAVIGDSFIEADIFVQSLRAKLQDAYGGEGVGYVSMYSEFPGFRSSVTQSGKGWTEKNIMKNTSASTERTLPGQYYVAEGAAESSYKGTRQSSHTSRWSRSRFFFIAPSGGSVTVSGESGSKTVAAEPSEAIQCLTLEGSTGSFSVATDAPGLKGLGVYLDGTSGVSVDCMSLRGNSGVGHRKTDTGRAAEMTSAGIVYDLIILEYGLNVLSGNQTEYAYYTRALTHTVRQLKACYPGADIMIMGIGDRGCKQGTDFVSMPTCSYMTAAQRKAASDNGCLFWDTREAQGGENAIVEWRNRNLVNADYVHINHSGGKELASLFVKALLKALE